MNDCIGIINLDEKDVNIKKLIKSKTISSMPIAGRYKVIDFALSNLTNSGIECIGIFTKRKSYSLIKHLSNGRPWDLHRKKDGLRVFNYSEDDPCYDDIHNFMNNMEFIQRSRKDYIIIIPSYMICNIDYKKVLNKHKSSNCDITIIYKKYSECRDFFGCEELSIGKDNKVERIKEIKSILFGANINMEMYIMKTSIFINIVKENITNGLFKKVKDYIRYNINELNIKGYEFSGYLSCINSTNSYFNTNMDILNMNICNELFHDNRFIFTKEKDEAPVYYAKGSKVSNSIIANGSYIEGLIENCIVGRKVLINHGTIIKNSIIMSNVIIKKDSIINNAIISSNFIIEENKKIEGLIGSPQII